MDTLIMALAPGFAAGFAVQRLLEIIDSVASYLVSEWAARPQLKRFVLTVAAAAVGWFIALNTDIRVLKPLGAHVDDALDVFATALVVSAGTEGWNTVLKYLGYKKEEQKRETNKLIDSSSDEPDRRDVAGREASQVLSVNGRTG